MSDKNQQIIDKNLDQEYKYGFTTDVEQIKVEPGLNEEVIKKLSNIKKEPKWANINYKPIDYQALSYYAAPKKKSKKSLDEVHPEILETYTKLGISLVEQKKLEGVAVDAVFDSVSVATTFKDELAKHGVIFCSFSVAVQEHPDIIKN